MKIADIINVLQTAAPLALQESYDNAGLILGSPELTVTGVMVSLDLTLEVAQEAKRRGCSLIVSHHPIIFKGLKRISGDDPVGQVLIYCIREDVAIYAIHTNLDNVPHGVNGRIARILGLENCKVLLPRDSGQTNPYPGAGSGLLGTLPEPLSFSAFLARVRTLFGSTVIRHSTPAPRPIQRVAVCGGAGSFLISNALEAGADAFLTGDLKYHEFFEPNGRMLLADIGHYESEQYTSDLLEELLKEKFPTFAVLKTTVVTNPIHYFYS
jgi:dinuclear metal center YbgI/SA1388 family protein